MRRTILFFIAGLLVGPVTAQHDHSAAPTVAWTQQPLLLPETGRRERDVARLRAVGISAPSVSVHAPAGDPEVRQREFTLSDGTARISSAAPQIGNYHWVVLREASPDSVRIASTAWYFSNPGASPEVLLATPKHELEIVPQPLPREHGQYRESEKWRFLVRLHGQPLVGQRLTLETEFGSRSQFVTDASGVATVLFPRDFPPPPTEQAGGHGRQSAAFVLSSEHAEGGQQYLTAFNLRYGPDAERGRSLGWGAAFGLAGMLAAAPLLRRRQSREVPHA
ncbi:MAG: hypothetical protein CVU34_09920 [Betaproteobacteria bacterium HGW-Betaproteobacteria-7]|jgi:hypothetical protein|nr:MAG: hypothetical protein CVU34_09920 [Betaproteobacteria bacterium HGW-Betaproteobacteria-7]